MRAISAQADQEDVLVPVRIDMESNGYQLRDTFTWNLNGMIFVTL
jgi:SNF5 / SMARCB1 / INI1